jgi:hypothetical protein
MNSDWAMAKEALPLFPGRVAVLTQWPSCEAGTGGEMPSLCIVMCPPSHFLSESVPLTHH